MKHLWSFLAFSKIYFIYVNTHGERHMFREDRQAHNKRYSAQCSFPLQPQLLSYTLSFYVQVPESSTESWTHKESSHSRGPLEKVTQSIASPLPALHDCRSSK